MARDQSGQGTVEYIVLLAVIVSFYLVIAQGFGKIGFSKKLLAPLNQDFARAYQYGHPKAKGYDDGGPAFHPRIEGGGENNFRIFINPEFQ